MCSLVKQNKALDEAPHPVETGKQRLFQFKKEVFDQNSSKGENTMEAQEKPAQRLGKFLLAQEEYKSWPSEEHCSGGSATQKAHPTNVKRNVSKGLTNTCLYWVKCQSRP